MRVTCPFCKETTVYDVGDITKTYYGRTMHHHIQCHHCGKNIEVHLKKKEK